MLDWLIWIGIFAGIILWVLGYSSKPPAYGLCIVSSVFFLMVGAALFTSGYTYVDDSQIIPTKDAAGDFNLFYSPKYTLTPDVVEQPIIFAMATFSLFLAVAMAIFSNNERKNVKYAKEY